MGYHDRCDYGVPWIILVDSRGISELLRALDAGDVDDDKQESASLQRPNQLDIICPAQTTDEHRRPNLSPHVARLCLGRAGLLGCLPPALDVRVRSPHGR